VGGTWTLRIRRFLSLLLNISSGELHSGWLKIAQKMTAEDVGPEALGQCFEDLYREWTAVAEPAVGTVLARTEYDIRLRIDVEAIRDDFEFLTG